MDIFQKLNYEMMRKISYILMAFSFRLFTLGFQSCDSDDALTEYVAYGGNFASFSGWSLDA